MQPDSHFASRATRWITSPTVEVSPAIAAQLISGLYTSVPIFLGGVINTSVVAAVAVIRHPTALFFLWLAIEITLGIIRLAVLLVGRRARRRGASGPIALTAFLSCLWAASVGFGAFISIVSGDWVLAIISCLSAAGMVSGICLRNFGTPRLVLVMMILSLLPCALAAMLAKEPMLLLISVQLPILMAVIGSAGFRMNALMVGRMVAQDALASSEAFNRSILESSPDYTLLLDKNRRIIFCNRPQAGRDGADEILGTDWLTMLPQDQQPEGRRALDRAIAGETARLSVAHFDPDGGRWFDLAISRISDGSGRVLLVARDITDQKHSEERALWMANHDPLTGLPNRVLLQNHLEVLMGSAQSVGSALLVLDIDNFKLINDTLGHDAGDALLCTFAERLTKAVRPDDLVARLGGDEFAIVLRASTEVEVGNAAEKIFAQINQPFAHGGQLVECNASIGACIYPRDGTERCELLKAADIALYSAKTAGRGQLKMFRNAMRNEFQNRSSMIFLARNALESDDVLPYYQPKIAFRTGQIIGFEALLRWRGPNGEICLPERLSAAFDEPILSAAIGDRMLERVLSDVRRWLDEAVPFGHVALNVAAAAFRSGRLADELLERLDKADIPPSCLQVEVTETVFLGRGADHVKRALRSLNSEGVRIALDDFGTGHAALAHLMQFPVDALKIDKSFIRGLGRNSEADAITKAIINLGQTLNIEIIAEGVETVEQETHLVGLGCQTGQGYLYSKAVPPATVRTMFPRAIAQSA